MYDMEEQENSKHAYFGNDVERTITGKVYQDLDGELHLAKNEKVFDGSVQRELESLAVQEFNTNQILNNASPANGSRFNFDF